MLLFGGELEISETKLTHAVNAVFETLKKELPEEARVYEICECVLDRCKDRLKQKKLEL